MPKIETVKNNTEIKTLLAATVLAMVKLKAFNIPEDKLDGHLVSMTDWTDDIGVTILRCQQFLFNIKNESDAIYIEGVMGVMKATGLIDEILAMCVTPSGFEREIFEASEESIAVTLKDVFELELDYLFSGVQHIIDEYAINEVLALITNTTKTTNSNLGSGVLPFYGDMQVRVNGEDNSIIVASVTNLEETVRHSVKTEVHRWYSNIVVEDDLPMIIFTYDFDLVAR